MSLKLSWLFIVLFSTFSAEAYGQEIKNGGELYASKCLSCHGEMAVGIQENKAPKLAGQFDWYLIDQLNAYKNNTRKKAHQGPYSSLSEKDIKDLAAYLSGIAAPKSEGT